MSIMMNIATALLGAVTKRMPLMTEPKLRARPIPTEATARPADFPGHTIAELTGYARPVVRLTPKGSADGRHLIYIHGGAFALPISSRHWARLARLVHGTGITVTVPLYELIPTGTAPDAETFLDAVYRDSLTEFAASRTTIGGDSAGGNLAILLALRARDNDTDLPAQLIAISPVVDFSLDHPAIPDVARHDPILRLPDTEVTSRLWRGSIDAKDPRVSPTYADLTGLPPVHLIHGGRDVLAPDVLDFERKLAEAGNEGTTLYEPLGIHVYDILTFTPEAKRAAAHLRDLMLGSPPVS